MIRIGDPQVVELFGANGITAKQQAKTDAQNITVGEARDLCNAVLNDFIANHLTQHMVPVVEHYMLQMPELVQAQLDAYFAAQRDGSPEATVERIMSSLEAEAKQSDTLGDPDE